MARKDITWGMPILSAKAALDIPCSYEPDFESQSSTACCSRARCSPAAQSTFAPLGFRVALGRSVRGAAADGGLASRVGGGRANTAAGSATFGGLGGRPRLAFFTDPLGRPNLGLGAKKDSKGAHPAASPGLRDAVRTIETTHYLHSRGYAPGSLAKCALQRRMAVHWPDLLICGARGGRGCTSLQALGTRRPLNAGGP